MTRKRFEALANALAEVRPHGQATNEEQAAFIAWSNAVESIRSTLATFNPRFDGERFSQACRERRSLAY